MLEILHEDKTYTNINYSNKEVQSREFINCSFENCDLSSSDFSHTDFTSCTFSDCNLSLIRLKDTLLNDVKFINCKMTGVDFSICNKYIFLVEFTQSHLDLSSFYGMKVTKTVFNNCSLKEVDFEEANFKESTFEKCDFMRANFMHTNVEKCDFRSSYDYSIHPANNIIKKAKFSATEIMGLLDSFDIIIE